MGESSPLLKDLWGPIESLRPLRTSLPRRLDFAQIRRSPRINDAPIDVAVLAVGVDPQPYLIGDPAVLSADGQWRLVERDLLNMRNPNMFEQQFELSPDGTILALGDAFGVVFLHLATGTTTRVATQLKDPVLHSWTGPSRGVLVTDRGGPGLGKAWEVTVTGTNLPVPFDPWLSAVGTDGRIVEFAPAPIEPRSKDSFTDVRVWRDGDLVSTRPLKSGVPQEATVARQWSTVVGVRQDPSKKLGSAGGLGALDPHTGHMTAFLPLPKQPLSLVSMQGLITNRWLMLSIPFGVGGGIFAWDPVRPQLRAVTEFDEQAASVSLANLLLP